MPAEHVELVQRHPVDVAQDELRGLEVACRIEHHAAPAKARCIVHGQCRYPNDAGLRRAAQLPQSHRPVEQARDGARCHDDAAGRDLEAVALRCCIGRRVEAKSDAVRARGIVGLPLDGEPDTAAAAEQLRKVARDGFNLGVPRRDERRVRAEREIARPGEQLRRARHESRRGLDGRGGRYRALGRAGQQRERSPKGRRGAARWQAPPHFGFCARCASWARTRSASASDRGPRMPRRAGGMWAVASCGGPNT